MEVLLNQFIKALTESGLLSADETETFIEGLPPEKQTEDGAALARELVRQGKLTKFQAQAIYQGKTKLILGDYVVLDRIGQGGMGQVYKAKHRVMKRFVALKTLLAAATKSDRAVRRFHREVKVAGRLTHPNIVTAFDAGEDHGVHFLVMEYVEGKDLLNLVKRHGRLPLSTALDYTIQAAKALEYAHSKDVIHRDIKPSNLLVDTEDTVKVLDMGLARINQSIRKYDASTQETLTGTGQALGTVSYMPPEQADNIKSVDQRADIYSLGCTLYFLLTGRSVYRGDNTISMVLAHREAPIPSLLQERRDLPRRLDKVFQKMVAKRPEERYASMTKVIAELDQCSSVRQEDLQATASFDRARMATVPPPRLTGVEGGHADDSFPLDLPVVSPVDDFLRTHRKGNKRRIVAASIVGGLALLIIVLAGLVFTLRTPDGTLIVEVNEPDAVVQVLDEQGKVEITHKSTGDTLTIKVHPGKKRLEVEKDGISWLAKDFEIESGERKVIRARLEPKRKEQTARSDPPLVIAPFTPEQAKQHQKAWADYLDVLVERDIDLGDGVKLTMVLVPPGEFLMGSADEKRRRLAKEAEAAKGQWGIKEIPTEGPQHRVVITRAFALSRYEVTRGQFRRFVEETGYETEAERDGRGGWCNLDGEWVNDPEFVWRSFNFPQTDEHPVVQVTWNDAQEFCEWLSNEHGANYHLPTEAQWEYACRAGTPTRWHCGDRETPLQRYAWLVVNAGGTTHPVGRLLPNGFGLHDMHGNVWEWCADWWAAEYYELLPVIDPSGATTGSRRVNRGGGWRCYADYCRSAIRNHQAPDYCSSQRGFRLACEVPQALSPSGGDEFEAAGPSGTDRSDGASELEIDVDPEVEGERRPGGRKLLLKLPEERGTIWSLAWSPTGNLLAVDTSVGGPVIWDISKIRSQLVQLELDWE